MSSTNNTCFFSTAPFNGDATFFEELVLELGGVKCKCEIAQGEILQQSLKLLPKHIRDKREKEARKRQKERNRPIVIGSTRFLNVAALRGRVKEILNSRSDGEQLKPGGSDYKLIESLLAYHPKGIEKSKGMVGIKVAKSVQGDSRCFYMAKEGGEEEDFSTKKCLDALEANPPYMEVDPSKDRKACAATTSNTVEAEAKSAATVPADATPTKAAPATSEAAPVAPASAPAAPEAAPAPSAAPAASEAEPAALAAAPAA